jgi:outer membrane protein assembly factor BamB
MRSATSVRCCCLVAAALAVVSCGGGARPSGDGAGRSGLAALPNSGAVFHSGGTFVGLTPGGAPAWEITLPAAAVVSGRLAVAPNSTVYARSRQALHAVDHHGTLLWTISLPEPPPALGRELLSPVALANSTVVALESPTRLRAFGLDGAAQWTAELPAGEANGALVACRNGLLLVPTTAGVQAFSPAGQLLWTWDGRPAS